MGPSSVSGLVLAVPPVGGAGVSEVGPVGSVSGELVSEVGVEVDALGVVAGAVVSGADCVAEADTSGCADALDETDGEEDADIEALASGEGLPLSLVVAGGFTAVAQSLGLDAVGDACSFLSSGVLLISGFGPLLTIPGTGLGTTPASMAAR